MQRAGRKTTWAGAVTFIAVLAAAWLGGGIEGLFDATGVAPAPSGDGQQIERLFESRTSGRVIEASGRVRKVLADDRHGSRHQRFLLEVEGGRTLLVSHNIDLAPRIPELAAGDSVEFRGQYEWNEKGGVVHWTHHDPGGRRPGGWLRHRGETYR